MARKKKPEEHENHERWLVSYADFITLLFAFFVVLYAISQVDLKKLNVAAKSFGTSFGGASDVGGDPEAPGKRVDPDAWRYAPIFPSVIPDKDDGSGAQGLAEVRDRLVALLATERLDAGVKVSVEGRGLVISTEPRALFQGSGAALSRDGGRLLERIGAIVRTLKSPVLIEGHAAPTIGAELASSYERSAARVAVVGRNFVAQQRLAPAHLFLSATGEAARQGAARVPDGGLDIVLIRRGAVRESLR